MLTHKEQHTHTHCVNTHTHTHTPAAISDVSELAGVRCKFCWRFCALFVGVRARACVRVRVCMRVHSCACVRACVREGGGEVEGGSETPRERARNNGTEGANEEQSKRESVHTHTHTSKLSVRACG
jgi:hypothetical protein